MWRNSIDPMSHLTWCPGCTNTCMQEDLMVAYDNAISVAEYWAATIYSKLFVCHRNDKMKKSAQYASYDSIKGKLSFFSFTTWRRLKIRNLHLQSSASDATRIILFYDFFFKKPTLYFLCLYLLICATYV